MESFDEVEVSEILLKFNPLGTTGYELSFSNFVKDVDFLKVVDFWCL